ncbi:MAG: hypothetical protein WAU42_01240 [Solirubrobacteraceae bacterium]
MSSILLVTSEAFSTVVSISSEGVRCLRFPHRAMARRSARESPWIEASASLLSVESSWVEASTSPVSVESSWVDASASLLSVESSGVEASASLLPAASPIARV